MPDRHPLLALAVLTLAACHHQNVQPQAIEKSTERSRQLAILAAREASLVQDADARLTRQLNIANGIRQRFTDQDSVAVLNEARNTLTTVGKELTGYARISGWVSVAQLARGAHDETMAGEATVEAERELEGLSDEVERCQYVMGVAEEVSQASGNSAAAKLLGKAGQWVSGMKDVQERRRARLAFSVALFNLDAWDEGVATLRHEGDAAWASDVLLSMSTIAGDLDRSANRERFALSREQPPSAAYPVEAKVDSVAPASATQSSIAEAAGGYGKPVNFRSNFEGKSRSTP